MTWAIEQLGLASLRSVRGLGRLAVFGGRVAAAAITPPIRFTAFIGELFNLGVLSLVIICVSGLAVGLVLGYQGYITLVRFGAEQSLGVVVGLSLIRELGPVLTALLVAGRAGSATAAQIGLMVATEQVDGLRMMSIDPVHLIVTPKVLAMIVAMPLLSSLFIVCGLWGGYLVGVGQMGVDPGNYFAGLRAEVVFSHDVLGGLIKSLIFGVLVGLIATYRGSTAQRTADGVGRATTSTVVIASVCVLIFDYFITVLWGA